MKYWFYSGGNITGPYNPDQLASLPGFGPSSLVCPENATGANPEDWKPAEEIDEINVLLMAEVSGAVSDSSGVSAYSPSYEGQSYPFSGVPSVMDEIDGILEAYKEEGEKEIDYNYDFADKFDLKLSKMQEELEAAKWEKTVLLEKVKAKESEEEKNRRKIEELEEKLKDALKRIDELKSRSEEISEIKREMERIEPSGKRGEGEKPEGERKKARSISDAASGEGVEAQNLLGRKEEEGKTIISSGSLKSLNRPKPKGLFEKEESDEKENEEISSSPEKKELKKDLEIEPSSIVYDFTAVVGKPSPAPSEKIKITIEENKDAHLGHAPREAAASPREGKPASEERPSVPSAPEKKTGTSAAADIPKPEPAPRISKPRPFAPEKPETGIAPIKEIKEELPSADSPAKFTVSSAEPSVAKTEVPPAAELARKEVKSPEGSGKAGKLGDKTERIVISRDKKTVSPKDAGTGKKKIKKSTIFFISVTAVFAVVIMGGLGFFFLNDSLSLADFSLLGTAAPSKTAESGTESSPAPAASRPSESEPAPEPRISAAEKIKRAIGIVKDYQLEGGRGSIENWLSNSFYAGSSANYNSEWSATVLHENIYVVQYRLLRQKKEPIVYQFEVDIEKGSIVRGINNNAIDLLSAKSAPRKKKVRTVKPRKKAVKKPAKKVRKKRSDSQLPLPEPPVDGGGYEKPTGFENVTLSANDKVKYIVAQESDEELF